MSALQDKTQFGLTRENNAVIERIEALGLFLNHMDAAKFAMAHAIREGIQPGSVPQAETKWHSGSFDPTGEIAASIKVLFPEVTTPYRAIEHLVNAGLEKLGAHLDQHHTLSLQDFLPE